MVKTASDQYWSTSGATNTILPKVFPFSNSLFTFAASKSAKCSVIRGKSFLLLVD